MAQPFCCFVDSIIRPSHCCYAINLTPNSFSNLVKKGSEYALQRELKRLQKHHQNIPESGLYVLKIFHDRLNFNTNNIPSLKWLVTCFPIQYFLHTLAYLRTWDFPDTEKLYVRLTYSFNHSEFMWFIGSPNTHTTGILCLCNLFEFP